MVLLNQQQRFANPQSASEMVLLLRGRLHRARVDVVQTIDCKRPQPALRLKPRHHPHPRSRHLANSPPEMKLMQMKSPYFLLVVAWVMLARDGEVMFSHHFRSRQGMMIMMLKVRNQFVKLNLYGGENHTPNTLMTQILTHR